MWSRFNLIKIVDQNSNSNELNEYVLKVKSILQIIQENSDLPLLKYFMESIFSKSIVSIQVIIKLIDVFDTDQAIDLFFKELEIQDIEYFKASFVNLKRFKHENGFQVVMNFLSKLLLKIGRTRSNEELRVIQNDNFIYQLADVFKDYEESYSRYLLFAMLHLCIKFKNFNETIANSIIDFMPTFFNK